MPNAQRRHRDAGPESGGPSDRANDALTNLSVYALRLDAEYHRLDDRLLELANTEPAAAELGTVSGNVTKSRRRGRHSGTRWWRSESSSRRD